MRPGAIVLSLDRRFPDYAGCVLACCPTTQTADVRLADDAAKYLAPSQYDTKKRTVKISYSKLQLV